MSNEDDSPLRKAQRKLEEMGLREPEPEPELEQKTDEDMDEQRKIELHHKKLEVLDAMKHKIVVEESIAQLEPVWSEYLMAIQALAKGLADNFTVTGSIRKKKGGEMAFVRKFTFFKDDKEVLVEGFQKIMKAE